MALPSSTSTRPIFGTLFGTDGEPLADAVLTCNQAPVRVDDEAGGAMVFQKPYVISTNASGYASGSFIASDDDDITPENWSYSIDVVASGVPQDTFYIRVTESIPASGAYFTNVMVSGNASGEYPTGVEFLNDLSDVTISSAVSGNVLYYNGTDWVNHTISGTGGSGSGDVSFDENGGLNIQSRAIQVGPAEHDYEDNLAQGGDNSAYVLINKNNTASDASLLFLDKGNICGEIGAVADNELHFKTVTGTAGSEVFTDRLIITASGSVWVPGKLGVGTIPVEDFHLGQAHDSGRTIAKIENTGSVSSSAAMELVGPGVDWSVGVDVGMNAGNNFYIEDNNAGYPPRMIIDTDGHVGIGTDSPTDALTVIGNVSADAPTASGHVATKAYVDANVGGGTVDTLPASVTLTVVKTSDGWPDRPTSRDDIIVQWLGADPSPSIVASGTGGMLDNVDIRLVTP